MLGFKKKTAYEYWRSRDNSIGIEMGHGLDSGGSIPVRGKRFFSSI
jgi:hypothetical protein